VADAVRQPVPARGAVPLKAPGEWRYIGKPMPVVDLDDIVHGRAVYGIDMVVPGMKYASVERPPVYGGRVKSFDASAAMAVRGVEKVVEIPTPSLPMGFHPVGGIAIIAANSWAAMQARQKLKIEWDLGPNADYDTMAYRASLEATAAKPGKVARSNGDVDTALKAAPKRVTADYFVPHIAHAMMEPEATVAEFKDGKCIVWSATQNPQQARATVAEVLGIDQAHVTINVTLLGGGFGRKSKPDYTAEAAFLARAAGAPVQVTWTREDNIAHDYYHAICAQHMEAGIDGDGNVQAWLHRTVFPSIGSTFTANTVYGSAGELGQGVVDMPYDVPNIRCENGPAQAHVRIGWYRSVYNIPHGFAQGSFADELAAEAGKDPVEFLLGLLGKPRILDLAALGVDYPNYGASIKDYPIDTGRLSNVVRLVADRSDWKSPLPAREGRGIAVHRSFLSYVAAVAHVAVAPDGTVKVLRVDLAVDCGLVLNPERVTAQFEGAAIMGLGNALYSSVSFRNGRVEQANFGDYQVARIDSTPETHVHIVPSSAPPGGVGEPGVPPVAAAICNAIFKATGRRIRSLPIDPAQLKSA
jgi:isoquinoline 1-oxidoreductase subunit beta